MRFRTLPGLLALLAVFHGCDFGNPTGGGTGGDGLTGVIVDPSGTPVVGAKVRVYPESDGTLSKAVPAQKADSTATGTDGSFHFKRLAAGLYNLEASNLRGDTTYSVFIPGIEVEGLIDLGVDTLRLSGSLSIEVRDVHNALVQGATCSIPGSPWTAVSDAGGVCEFPVIAPGTYRIRVTAAGVSALTPGLTVPPGADVAGGDVSLIGEDWVLVSMMGYAFYVPPELELKSVGWGLDSWSASYGSSTLYLSLFTGMVGPLERPDSFPDYSETKIPRDSGELLLITYRVPEAVAHDFRYQAGAQWTGMVAKAIMISPIFTILGKTPEDLERGVRILRSIRRWTGPGPEPRPAPPKVSLLGPDQNATGVSASPSLSWSAVAVGDSTITNSYRLQVSTDGGFSSFVVNEPVAPSGTSGTLSRTVGPLTAGARYYWRVIAVGPGGSTSSETRSFVVAIPPAVPTLTFPAEGEDSIPVQAARLSWDPPPPGSGPVTAYRVQVRTDTAFSTGALFQDTLPAWTLWWYVPYNPSNIDGSPSGPRLGDGVRYYWRVIAVGDGQAPSEVRSFVTTPFTPIARQLRLPDNGATGVALSPTLAWDVLLDGDSWRYFRVQVSPESLFVAPVVNDSIASNAGPPIVGGNHSWTVGASLQPSTRYFWRVLAVGNLEATSSSAVRSFTTVSSP